MPEFPTETQADPFDLSNDEVFARWLDTRLGHYPVGLEDLIVEVSNPLALTESERDALECRIERFNMAIYAASSDLGRPVACALGEQFGVYRVDHNMLADDDGVTPLAVSGTGERSGYVPYTNRPINWHTDGYYNAMDRQVHSLLLHCVQPAFTGGENGLMDHEVAYGLLRRQNPDYVRALMEPDAMTIPAGLEAGGVMRGERVGPVFSVDPGTRHLHMRFTGRRTNIRWKDDGVAQEAAAALLELLNKEDSPFIVRGRLEAGMGLICNNVLHNRSGFEDSDSQQRLLYRCRYYDRIHPSCTA